MPVYTYRCDACGAREDHLHSASDRLRVACPECDAPQMTWQFPCPNLVTDATFSRGSDDGFGCDNRSRKIALAKAKAAGVSVVGKKFNPQLVPLGGELFDPAAWVDSRGDVKRICEKHGWGANGTVNVKPVVLDEPHPLEENYQVSNELVERKIADVIDREHGGKVTPKKRQDLFDHHKERMSGTQI